MKKIVKKVVAKKAPVKKLVKAQKGVSTGAAASIKDASAPVKKLVKAQKGVSVKKSSTPADSAKIYKDQYNAAFDRKMSERFFNKSFPSASGEKKIKEKQAEEDKAYNNMIRQYNKGKKGYTEMGFKIQPKDKEGRSSTSKWYGYDPKAKKYTMGPNKGKTHAQVMKSKKGQ